MESYDLKHTEKIEKVYFHNIILAFTESYSYDESRFILLENLPDTKFGEYVVVEGSHCSCYGFEDTEYYATKYDREELIKLAKIHNNELFYKMILEYFIGAEDD